MRKLYFLGITRERVWVNDQSVRGRDTTVGGACAGRRRNTTDARRLPIASDALLRWSLLRREVP